MQLFKDNAGLLNEHTESLLKWKRRIAKSISTKDICLYTKETSVCDGWIFKRASLRNAVGARWSRAPHVLRELLAFTPSLSLSASDIHDLLLILRKKYKFEWRLGAHVTSHAGIWRSFISRAAFLQPKQSIKLWTSHQLLDMFVLDTMYIFLWATERTGGDQNIFCCCNRWSLSARAFCIKSRRLIGGFPFFGAAVPQPRLLSIGWKSDWRCNLLRVAQTNG